MSLLLSKKAITRTQTILLLVMIVIAAVGVFAFYGKIPSGAGFKLLLTPNVLNDAPGEGRNVTVTVDRSGGLTGDVEVTLLDAPKWALTRPLTIPNTASSGVLTVAAAKEAPKVTTTITVQAKTANTQATAKLTLRVVGTSSFSYPEGNITLYDSTKVLDTATQQALLEDSNGTMRFNRFTPLLQGLVRGDVITSGPTRATPYGFLRTVLSVRQESGNVIVETDEAAIEDAFQQLYLNPTETAAPTGPQSISSSRAGNVHPLKYWSLGEYTVPIAHLALGGDVTADGSVTIGAGIYIGWDIHWKCDPWCYPRIFYFELNLVLSETAKTKLTGTNSGGNINIEPKDLVPPQTIATIPVIDGILWITVKLRWIAGATGSGVYAKLDMDVSESCTIRVGPKYVRGEGLSLKKEADCGAGASVDAPIPPGGAEQVKVFAGPRMELLLYDVAGPYGQVDAFLDFDLKTPRKPVWLINGGLEASFGFKVNIDLKVKTIKFNAEWGRFTLLEKEIARSQNYPPFTPVIQQPQDGATLDLSLVFKPQFVGTASDPEDTDLCSPGHPIGNIVWSSNVDGQLGTGCSITSGFKTAGDHEITLTVTDSDGASSSATITVKVTAPTPQVWIDYPNSDATFNVGDKIFLKGHAMNPGGIGNLPCDQLAWYIYPKAGDYTLTIPELSFSGCDAQNSPVSFGTSGQRRILLKATNQWGFSETAYVDIDVIGEQMHGQAPTVQVNSPPNAQYFTFRNDVIALQGTATSNNPGGYITSATWYAKWPIAFDPSTGQWYYNTITIATGLDGAMQASAICASNYNPSTTLTIRLEAADSFGLTGADEVHITLGCQKPVASPPYSRTPSIQSTMMESWGLILAPMISSQKSLIATNAFQSKSDLY